MSTSKILYFGTWFLLKANNSFLCDVELDFFFSNIKKIMQFIEENA